MKNRDLELMYELGTLRFIKRAWVQVLTPNFANLAEHHFRVAWTAMLLAKMEKNKNLEKILIMALIHDITESRTGDVHYISRQYTKRDEHLAITDMLKETSLGNLKDLWEEYEAKKSPEAKIVKDADSLDVDFELIEQAATGNVLRKEFRRHRGEAVYKMLFTKSAKKLWREIQKSNPHDWHLNGRNRFNNGDWMQFNKKLKK